MQFNLYKGKRGGRRPGSGRKRIHSKGVAHRTREEVTQRTPLHINFKYRTYIKNKERYHLHVLRSLRETKNAIHYVLFNKQKHEKGIYSKIDGYSSILSLKNGLELIRRFCHKKKMTIVIEKTDPWDGDLPKSYLAIKGLTDRPLVLSRY